MAVNQIDVVQIYNRDKNLKKSDVEALADWAAKQPHLPKISELQIILFLHSCFYSNELAKTTIDNFFTIKTLCPDIFGGRNPKDPNMITALNCILFTNLPKLTHDNYSIIFGKFMDSNPDRFQFSNIIRLFDMNEMQHLHNNGPENGVYILFDMNGMVFGHLTRLNIVVMKKFFYYLQEAIPIRLKGIHFINVVPFIDKILALMKPFMKKELFDVLYVHSESIESLYKFIPQECLPAEYGGQCDPVKKLHENIISTINKHEDFYKYEETQRVDESKRKGRPKNAGDFFGVEGTFKKLEFD